MIFLIFLLSGIVICTHVRVLLYKSPVKSKALLVVSVISGNIFVIKASTVVE